MNQAAEGASDDQAALADVRVLDLTTGAAGAVAGMFLADFGADVVRVGRGGSTEDPGAVVWHRNKRLVSRAPSEPADVVLIDGAASEWAGRRPDPAVGAEGPGDPVLVHLGPFTEEAPWPGGGISEQKAWAASGLAQRQVSYAGGAVEMVVPCISVIQGAWAAAVAVAALRERLASGRGQRVTVSALHALGIAGAAAFTFDSAVPEAVRPGPRIGGPGGAVPFYRLYRCGDGEWLFLAALTPHFSARAFATLGMGDILDDPRLEGGGRAALLHPDHSGWVIEEMAAVFATRTRQEWLDALAGAGCPAGPVLERDAWLDHPQLEAIGMRLEADHAGLGPVVMPGFALNLTTSPARLRQPLGADEPASDGWVSSGLAGPGARPERSGADGGPLADVRVLDLGAIIAGPFAGTLLADLGADVIKVEPPGGDSFRGPGFAVYNKGQRSIALDLQRPEGRQVLLDLAKTADVVIDNYRPGVLGRLGLTHADLAAVNPQVITLTITGFGTTGPLGGEAGFDPVLQAMSGIMEAQGGDSEPVFLTVPVNDVTAATVSALGACLALLFRSRGGGGQHLWTSLAGMSALLQAPDLVRYQGRPAPRRGGRDHALPEDAAVGNNRELMADQSITAFGFSAADPRPGRESWRTTHRLARLSRTQRASTLVAPNLGQHTREVLAEAGRSESDIDQLIEGGAAVAGDR
jgi:crotonobetainyl-CoA:carnitine CoA-transferase CaiB-like acyl-CoA transferase